MSCFWWVLLGGQGHKHVGTADNILDKKKEVKRNLGGNKPKGQSRFPNEGGPKAGGTKRPYTPRDGDSERPRDQPPGDRPAGRAPGNRPGGGSDMRPKGSFNKPSTPFRNNDGERRGGQDSRSKPGPPWKRNDSDQRGPGSRPSGGDQGARGHGKRNKPRKYNNANKEVQGDASGGTKEKGDAGHGPPAKRLKAEDN